MYLVSAVEWFLVVGDGLSGLTGLDKLVDLDQRGAKAVAGTGDPATRPVPDSPELVMTSDGSTQQA